MSFFIRCLRYNSHYFLDFVFPEGVRRASFQIEADMLIMHRKFFELYEDDARVGHQEFDLKLTARVKMSMVGVPEMSFDFWAA